MYRTLYGTGVVGGKKNVVRFENASPAKKKPTPKLNCRLREARRRTLRLSYSLVENVNSLTRVYGKVRRNSTGAGKRYDVFRFELEATTVRKCSGRFAIFLPDNVTSKRFPSAPPETGPVERDECAAGDTRCPTRGRRDRCFSRRTVNDGVWLVCVCTPKLSSLITAIVVETAACACSRRTKFRADLSKTRVIDENRSSLRPSVPAAI